MERIFDILFCLLILISLIEGGKITKIADIKPTWPNSEHVRDFAFYFKLDN